MSVRLASRDERLSVRQPEKHFLGMSRNTFATPLGHSEESHLILRQIVNAAEQFNFPASRQVQESDEEVDDSQLARTERNLLAGLQSFHDRLSAQVRQRIESRLRAILESDNWEVGQKLPDIRSFVLMVKFLSENTDFRAPTIFLTPQGFFVASWRPAQNKLVSLIFQPNETVSWLVFAPGTEDPGETEEAAGHVNARSLLRRLRAFGALDWIKCAA